VAAITCIVLAIGAGAAVYNYFAKVETNVSVHGITLKFDNDPAYDKLITETLNIAAGSTNITYHNITYIGGDGNNVSIAFEHGTLPVGFTFDICYKLHSDSDWLQVSESNSMQCEKDELYDLRFNYTTDPKFIPEVFVVETEIVVE
jgi:hypothetical protein